jgi:hypothetical protein
MFKEIVKFYGVGDVDVLFGDGKCLAYALSNHTISKMTLTNKEKFFNRIEALNSEGIFILLAKDVKYVAAVKKIDGKELTGELLCYSVNKGDLEKAIVSQLIEMAKKAPDQLPCFLLSPVHKHFASFFACIDCPAVCDCDILNRLTEAENLESNDKKANKVQDSTIPSSGGEPEVPSVPL